jgi:hypothetical protein
MLGSPLGQPLSQLSAIVLTKLLERPTTNDAKDRARPG